LGRFISVDPVLNLGVPGHFNAYSYAYSNPMTFSDPSGLEPASEKIGLGKKPGAAGTPPPSTSWAALAACSDFWCQQGWHWSTSTQVLGGLAENIGQLVWSTVAPPGAVEGITNLVDMVTDWDGFWTRKEEERQAQLDFWSGPDPWGEAWNSFWAPIADDWVNNPGHALGGTIATVGTFAVPGGGLIKGANLAAKGANAVKGGTTATRVSGADNSVDLFRHASPAEVADIGTNGFRSTANSLEGKWFAETAAAAAQWGKALNGGAGSIVQVRVPESFAGQLGRWPSLDGIGPARFVGPEQLGQLNQFPRGVL
jgi:hypothetical protein